MKFTIDSESKSVRLDKFVQKALKNNGFNQATRNMIQDSISKGVVVNDRVAKASYRLKQGDTVKIDEKYWKTFFDNLNLSEEIVPQKGELDILHEDNDILVLVKPKGLVVHPGVANEKDTLANYIKYYLQSNNEFDQNMDRAGIVHRLDKGVSGILVAAKNKKAQEDLREQFSKRKVEKIYLAQTEKFKNSSLTKEEEGNLKEVLEKLKWGIVDYIDWFRAEGYIGRGKVNRYKMVFKLYQFSGSKPAKSFILPIGDDQFLIKIVTGRMHQIRATLHYYGYNIKGDELYSSNRKSSSSEKIMLKSIYLSFSHPKTKERLSFLNI